MAGNRCQNVLALQWLKSKGFVELCNKNGHCVSYDTVLRIETRWADDMLTKDEGYSSIPSNIVCNQFTQFLRTFIFAIEASKN